MCGRQWVGRGRQAAADSPASFPHRPLSPPGALSPPKRRRGGAPGLRLRSSPRTGARGREGQYDHGSSRCEPNPCRRGGAAARDRVDFSSKMVGTTSFILISASGSPSPVVSEPAGRRRRGLRYPTIRRFECRGLAAVSVREKWARTRMPGACGLSSALPRIRGFAFVTRVRCHSTVLYLHNGRDWAPFLAKY